MGVEIVEIVEGEEQFWGEFGASGCNQWDPLREGRRRALLKRLWEGLVFVFIDFFEALDLTS